MLFSDNLDIQQVMKNFDELVNIFTQNMVSKNAFLAVCQVIASTKDTAAIKAEYEYGILIGPGNNFRHPLFQTFRLFRVYYDFHDVFGFMKEYNFGPGYVHTLGEEPLFKNSCLLGHFTGLFLWMYLKLIKTQISSSLAFWPISIPIVSC